mmetsp:Transcript_51600/g.111917  ORF Transcript_51600/g.111917 Transcript_51600/m.111917 type:complete len:292 (-) Transcript_51600:748-1623(-)
MFCMLPGESQKQRLVAHDLLDHYALAVRDSAQEVDEGGSNHRRLIAEHVRSLRQHCCHGRVRERVGKNPSITLCNCGSHQRGLLVLRASIHEDRQKSSHFSSWQYIPVVFEDATYRANADSADGFTWILKGLSEEPELLHELLVLICDTELPGQQGEYVLQEPGCILPNLPISNLQTPPQNGAVDPIEELVHALLVVVTVHLFEHGTCSVSTFTGRLDCQQCPVLHAVLHLKPSCCLGGLEGFEEPHGVRLHWATAEEDLILHRAVHLGCKARVCRIEASQHVGPLGSPHE